MFEQIMLADFRPPYLGGQMLSCEAIPTDEGFFIPWAGLNCAVNAYVRYVLNVPASSGIKVYLDTSETDQEMYLCLEDASDADMQVLLDKGMALPSALLREVIADANLQPFIGIEASEQGLHFLM